MSQISTRLSEAAGSIAPISAWTPGAQPANASAAVRRLGGVVRDAVRLRDVEPEVEAVAGDGHDRGALAVADVGGPGIRRADRGIHRHEAVEVGVPRVLAHDRRARLRAGRSRASSARRRRR
jgi:hypothetical protein